MQNISSGKILATALNWHEIEQGALIPVNDEQYSIVSYQIG